MESPAFFVVSKPHMAMSDQFFEDAQSSAQSLHGRVDCAVDSGYFALLSVLSAVERDRPDHPIEAVLSEAARRLSLDMQTGHRLLSARYAVDDERPSLEEAMAWAESVRRLVREH
jgi:hypothetical protein